MKVAWHPEAGVVVLSLWTADNCTATFRLPIDRAPDLVHLLVDAVADEPSLLHHAYPAIPIIPSLTA
jgi:hypothetical protein